ncbi:Subtilase family protein [Microbacterium oxydans]|uniref:Subtilase family protein n=1 Tax=Microbacterium oxydans TaxID=82380 RepID=A0A0F0KPW6_9MICO|nr:S8 family serine peptidase [Microbacterium oxydans]KJL22957.1 Subtilase family protein [Microbacterium oxydans]
MANHLPLPTPINLTESKRRPPNPTGTEVVFNPRRQATTLRGILEGLESNLPGAFVSTSEEEDGIDASELGRIVLKITGTMAFTTSGLGSWDHKLVALGISHEKTFYALSDADSRRFFRELVDTYDADPDGFDTTASWKQALDQIANIELYDRGDRETPDLPDPGDDGVVVVDISAWPTSIATRGAEKEAKARITELVELIDSSDDDRVHVIYDDADPDRPVIRAQLGRGMLDVILDHPLVEKVRGPLQADVTVADLAGGSRPQGDVVPSGAAIGIIDDQVIDSNPWLHGVVVKSRSFPDDGSMGMPTAHATQVAGIAAWGRVADLLDGDPGRSPRPIYSARVAHSAAQGRTALAGAPTVEVAAAMRWLASEGVRIVVFAFAYPYADDDALPSDLTAVIDELARELNLVVVLSAGNLTALPEGTHWKTDYPTYLHDPSARIASPGAAALALTVGSVAHSHAPDTTASRGAVRIADIGQPAPFSRTGPTVTGRHKPEFSGHGGSWSWDQATGTLLTKDANIATTTLTAQPGGRLFSAVAGTSFAAPFVAHEVAEIATRYPDASANRLRALTALSALPPDPMPAVIHSAYGVPDASQVLESDGPRAIFVHDGTIERDTYQVISVPIPDEFAKETFDRELRVALAFDPAVRRSRRDYISGRIKVQLYRNHTLEEITQIFRQQPTVKERAAGATAFGLPDGRNAINLLPGSNSVNLDTVMCRSIRRQGGWDPDDHSYFLVLTHSSSPWTDSQKNDTPTQDYAIAVELLAHGRPQLDLHAAAEAQLTAQTEAQLRQQGRQRERGRS